MSEFRDNITLTLFCTLCFVTLALLVKQERIMLKQQLEDDIREQQRKDSIPQFFSQKFPQDKTTRYEAVLPSENLTIDVLVECNRDDKNFSRSVDVGIYTSQPLRRIDDLAFYKNGENFVSLGAFTIGETNIIYADNPKIVEHIRHAAGAVTTPNGQSTIKGNPWIGHYLMEQQHYDLLQLCHPDDTRDDVLGQRIVRDLYAKVTTKGFNYQ